jgi:hypothetical protein
VPSTRRRCWPRAGVRDGQPFVLGSDGSYDLALNRFLRELDGWGVRAANSIGAYARDVMLFCRFLHDSRGGKAIWECDGADLRAFKRVRLRTPGDGQVSVATWRWSIAALDKWAAWAVYEGLLKQSPRNLHKVPKPAQASGCGPSAVSNSSANAPPSPRNRRKPRPAKLQSSPAHEPMRITELSATTSPGAMNEDRFEQNVS